MSIDATVFALYAPKPALTPAEHLFLIYLSDAIDQDLMWEIDVQCIARRAAMDLGIADKAFNGLMKKRILVPTPNGRFAQVVDPINGTL